MNKKELERFLMLEGSTPLGCYNTLNECISRIRESDEIQPVKHQHTEDLRAVIALLEYLKSGGDVERSRYKEYCVGYVIEIEDDFGVRLDFHETVDGIELLNAKCECISFFETWEELYIFLGGYYDGLEKGAKTND